MGQFFSGFSTLQAPRLRGQSATQAMNDAFWAGEPIRWFDQLAASGMTVTPELAMTLSAYYCGVTTICYDLATLPPQVLRSRDDGGTDVVRPIRSSFGNGGIGSLAYLVSYQPNHWQTTTEYLLGMYAQLLLRGRAYAEIVPGPSGFVEQLLPRHPDRVSQERLPSGRLRYKLIEADGTPRYLTQDEMHVVRDISFDGGMTTTSRVQYGAQAISTALAAEAAANKFFKSGMTAAKVASYKGEKDGPDEDALHASISRFATGVENSFGLMLVPDDITITDLGVEPEKAQMMLAREWGVYEVARHLRISPRKLMMRTATAGYGSAYQDAIDHVVGCLRPLAHTVEDAMRRDLILARDLYKFKFDLRELLRGDPAQMGEFIEKVISNRAMTPSEVRMALLDLNPNPRLDTLSESDNQPGKKSPTAPAPAGGQAVGVRAHQIVHDNALRCLRRERAAIAKKAVKHANDPKQWAMALREFYAEHAGYLAERMRLEPVVAAAYGAQHGTAFELNGAKDLLDDQAYGDWERVEADRLTGLALEMPVAA